MSDKVLAATKNGAIFIQPDGPNTQPLYMGCIDLDDISEPLGDIEIAQCYDPNGNPQTMGTMVGMPGVALTAVNSYLQQVLDALRSHRLPLHAVRAFTPRRTRRPRSRTTCALRPSSMPATRGRAGAWSSATRTPAEDAGRHQRLAAGLRFLAADR